MPKKTNATKREAASQLLQLVVSFILGGTGAMVLSALGMTLLCTGVVTVLTTSTSVCIPISQEVLNYMMHLIKTDQNFVWETLLFTGTVRVSFMAIPFIRGRRVRASEISVDPSI